MLFTGDTELTIDAKLRLQIPAKYRNQWNPARDGAAWYCIPWPTGHLRLYTEARFEEFARRGENSLTPGEAEADLESSLFSFAERIEADGGGRLLLPRTHLELVGLGAGSEVVVIGARVRLEVRERAAWRAAVAARFANLPGLVAQVEAQRRGRGGATGSAGAGGVDAGA